MSEHTTEPWYAEGYVVMSGKHGIVCRISWGHEKHERLANARLIAAAPDLLEAILKSDDAHWTPAMRAAIAKAEGRT